MKNITITFSRSELGWIIAGLQVCQNMIREYPDIAFSKDIDDQIKYSKMFNALILKLQKEEEK